MTDSTYRDIGFAAVERVAAIPDDLVSSFSAIDQALIETCREMVVTGGGKNEK